MAEKAKEKSSKTVSWESYPGLKEFWDAFVDLFWGKGGTTPYWDMLKADEDWLRKAYMANNDLLEQMERKYLSRSNIATQQYERGLESAKIPIRSGGSRSLGSIVPTSEQQVQKNLFAARMGQNERELGIGKTQTERRLALATRFTPYKTQRKYIEQLGQAGMKGQTLRSALPTVKTTASLSGSGAASKAVSGLTIAGGTLDLFSTAANIDKKYGVTESISDWDIWKDLSDWGSEFWNWLTGTTTSEAPVYFV